MPQDAPWYDDVFFPALLRHARTTYGRAMRQALEQAGCEDVPANGLYVIGAMALDRFPLGEIITELGVSKQAAGQLVDTLVLRGYLERHADVDDRRKLTVTLTERGRMAAAAQAAARARIDEKLLARVGAEKVCHARMVLGTLIDMDREGRDVAA